MDKLTAFEKIWAVEGNATRAAAILSYALLIQLVGWDKLGLEPRHAIDIRNALGRAGVDPADVVFLAEQDPLREQARLMTMPEMEAMRREQEREFGGLTHNMRGRRPKSRERRARRLRLDTETEAET